MMLIYPGMDNIAHSRTLGATRVQVAYHGRRRTRRGRSSASTRSTPCCGVQRRRRAAPEAAVGLRVRHHHQGRDPAAVIPDHTTAVVTVRANDAATLEAVIPRIDACLTGAAAMTGARLERIWREPPGRALLSNFALAQSFERNLQALGRPTRPRDELSGAWSGDTGNVSWSVPTIQPQIAMTGRDVPPHSHEFHAASIGSAAEACILDSAKAMAMTAIDLLTDPALLARVKAEFANAT